MFTGHTPDITPAQILAFLAFVGTEAVAAGVLTQPREQLIVSIGGIVVPAAWKIADAIIRYGRNQRVAPLPPPAMPAPGSVTLPG